MTDKQVEEALKYCPTHDSTNYCDKCALNGVMGCRNELMIKASETIQKLKEERTALMKKLDGQWTFKTVTAGCNTSGKLNVLEIVRRVEREEFADKLKEICVRKRVPIDLDDEDGYYFDVAVTIDEIDKLLKEYEK